MRSPAAAAQNSLTRDAITDDDGHRPLGVRQPKLRVLLTLSWLVGLAVIPEGLVVPLAHELGLSDMTVGYLLAADPLGFVLGVAVLARLVPAQVRVRLIGVLATCSAGVLVLFAAQPSLLAATILLVLAGAFGGYQVVLSGALNLSLPSDIRGGAFQVVRTGLRAAQGVSIVLGGLVARLLGSVATTIAFGGLLGMLIAVPATIMWSRLVGAPALRTGRTRTTRSRLGNTSPRMTTAP